jgi:1-aminocyclopropane-1-carboxylate deaminase/D-cysteine desulfhydrase-like pyridoxal-dependent ACC family enzyme
LAYAFNETNTQILGICSDPEPELVQDFAELGRQLAPLIGANDVLKPEAFNLNVEYVGPGYGVPSPEGDEAIRRMARAEGILLDPIYTGKAFAGLLDLVNRREIGGRILFWHTGGVPALFADQGW